MKMIISDSTEGLRWLPQSSSKPGVACSLPQEVVSLPWCVSSQSAFSSGDELSLSVYFVSSAGFVSSC